MTQAELLSPILEVSRSSFLWNKQSNLACYQFEKLGPRPFVNAPSLSMMRYAQATPPAPPRRGSNVDKPWLPARQTTYKLVNVNIVDPLEGKIIENASVVLAKGYIKSVTQNPSAGDDDEDIVVVDLQGLFLCPGLIDAHVHVTATPGEQGLKNTYKNISQSMNNFRTTYVVKEMLARGFTTVRDCGGADGALKDAIAEWLIIGPRLVIAGHALSQTGGHGDQRAPHEDDDPSTRCCAGHKSGISRLCDGPTECITAVRDEIRKGAGFIKIMAGGGVSSRLNNLAHAQFLPEELSAIVRTAASFDTYVTAHAYSNRAMRHAVENGVRGIEHGNFLDQETAEYLASNDVSFQVPFVVLCLAALGAFRKQVLTTRLRRRYSSRQHWRRITH